jgi:leucyl/phenylalanyl-tRNA---protein transferase
MALTVLDDSLNFPPVDLALKDPNGLLAIGGDLSPQRLVAAYAHGVFPWFSDDDTYILWWSPDPRAHLPLDNYSIKRSLRKTIKKSPFQLSINHDFEQVIDRCSAITDMRTETWITYDMREAYIQLHQQGHAHSIEVWSEDELIGGLYGINIGRCFFGESMFTRRTDASKMAFYFLAGLLKQNNALLLDCQMPNPHLDSLGVLPIKREDYQALLAQGTKLESLNIWNQPAKFNAQSILEMAP